MSETRTIEWASVAGWVSENEQQIRDVMKFEGLKGAMVEVLRLAPDQPELAALREELATAKRNEHNSEIAYKAAIEKQEELREACVKEFESVQALDNENSVLKQRLADAERRNAVCADLLSEVLNEVPHGWGESFSDSELAERIRAALNPKPEAASHD